MFIVSSITCHNIDSIQKAINFFQNEELIEVNCNINQCQSKCGKRTFKFLHSSKYLIMHLKRFIGNDNGSIKINKKIFINDRISINNGKQQYSLISVLHHLGDSINNGHYIVTV